MVYGGPGFNGTLGIRGDLWDRYTHLADGQEVTVDDEALVEMIRVVLEVAVTRVVSPTVTHTRHSALASVIAGTATPA